MAFPEYGAYDAVGLAELIRTGQIAPAEVVGEAIARIERINPAINAVVTPMFEQARRAVAGSLPPGPLRGVPFLLKDLGAACQGVRLADGSRFLAGVVPDHDSTLVRRYREAGLVFVGKTNCPEIGLVPVTEPVLFGPTRNPWDPARTPGGSSGGSAAAVASGMVPAAHGGDGGGSLRIPASCCGLFALKPTRGRTPPGPDRSELWGGMAIEHALGRSVRDSAALLDATSAADPDAAFAAPPAARSFSDELSIPPGRLRVAVSLTPSFPVPVHPDCVAAAEDAARLLAELGHEVETIELVTELGLDRDAIARDFFLLVCTEVASTIADAETRVGRRARPGDFERDTWLSGMIGRRRTALEALGARGRLQDVSRRVARFFAKRDVLLSPTLAQPPLPIGSLRTRGVEGFVQSVVASFNLGFLLDLPGVIDKSVRKVFSFIPFTPLANFTGQPSMSVPLFWNAQGLPIGTMFTGRFGDEATLFRLAAQLEVARPWAHRRPPIHADVRTSLSGTPPISPEHNKQEHRIT
jgi:amidase